jgi:hypothetical protein
VASSFVVMFAFPLLTLSTPNTPRVWITGRSYYQTTSRLVNDKKG